MNAAVPPDLLTRLSSGVRAYVLLAALAIVAALPGFFSIPPLDRDESRFAQATAQMLETGDFVRIAVQDDPRNKKPVGIHWLQAATVAAVSKVEAREIWAYRLPSMAGAALAALAAFWGGAALIGRRAAFVGAAFLASSILLSTEGMIAKTDAVLCGFTTLALAALARLRMREAGRSGGALALTVWIAIGLGTLVKGPITPMVVGLTLAGLWGLERRLDWAKPLVRPAGPIAALLIVLPWLVAIQMSTGGAFLREAVGHDLGTKLSGGGEHPFTPPGFHMLLLPILSFPVTLGLIGGVRLAWAAVRGPRAEADGAPLRFLVAWAVPTFLVFEAAPTKLVHYPLPTYPAIALIAAAGLVAMMERGWTRTRWASVALAALVAAGLAALCSSLAGLSPATTIGGAAPAAQAAIVGGAAAAAWLVALAMTRRPAAWLALGLCAALVFTWTARERLAPSMRTVLVSQAASQALKSAGLHPRFDPNIGRLWIVGYREPSLVFLTATDSVLADGSKAGETAPEGAAMLIESRQRDALNAALAQRGMKFEPSGPAVEGRNYSNGQTVALQPGRVRPAL